MIFAELRDEPAFESLLANLEARFGRLRSGLQSDAWIWIGEAQQRVSVDTFTSMAFQVKCADPESPLLTEVLEHLQDRVDRLDPPEFEAHE